jgi:hypothetical protein
MTRGYFSQLRGFIRGELARQGPRNEARCRDPLESCGNGEENLVEVSSFSLRWIYTHVIKEYAS